MTPPLNSYAYMLQHKRVYRARGKASAHQCVGCPRQAGDWARIHTESGDDPWSDYVPACRGCLRYDRVNEAVRAANRRRRGVPLSAAHRDAISRSKLGHTPSAATRAKISASLRGAGRSR